ncbi:alanine/glycine:cation symporter family protein [Haematomicrobium sanguinis]|uniref:alanine/glycine:cation symporter family protein n=1 Tax=Haematomicrobium sanguinis TaxID=479106 RepID=UPI00054E7EF2|nr:alanine/glycine:cation symporter family protein [Haematomicrobium sanguinis]
MDAVVDFISTVGGWGWTWIILPVLAIVGIYFTIRSGVVQARLLPQMVKTLGDKALVNDQGEKKSISSFQAFTVSAASRVGAGNVAGVAVAIATGGPGAIFWMWLMAFIGGASSFVESTLGQLYKVRGKDGYHGGPAYYMQRGLGQRWLGIIFAIVLIFCFPFAFSALQGNTINASIMGAMPGADPVAVSWTVAIVLAVLSGLVIFGGIRRIANVTDKLVPIMALAYVLIGIIVVITNIGELPRVIGSIFSEAFNFQSAVGGSLGAVILIGAQRGMFSNEAGLGSAPNAGATASVTHPVKQGLVQTLGVYFDTFIICSVTAFIILSATPEAAGTGDRDSGIQITQNALVQNLGAATGIILAIIIFMLAFSSILGNYYYGESNIRFITENKTVMLVFRIVAIAAVVFGTVATTSAVWDLADNFMGVMALINLVSIALLGGIAMKLLKNYTAQVKNGKDPVFLSSQMPELKGVESWEEEDVTTSEIPVVRRRR